MKFGQKTMALGVAITMMCILGINSANAAECRLDWNRDYQIDESDYLTGSPMGGFYAEWYIHLYYPAYYPTLFPSADSGRLDYDGDADIDQDDLMGGLEAALDTEGFYVEWYIFIYYPGYYPIFFPEYDVCPPVAVTEGCAAFEVVDLGGLAGWGNPRDFTELGGKLYLVGNLEGWGEELLVYDPATEMVSAATDINPGTVNSGIMYVTALSGKLYFHAATFGEEYEAELYVYDPATGLATKIDLNPTGSSSPRELMAASNGMLYFRAIEEDDDEELWEYNPSTGVSTIYEIYPGMDIWDRPLKGQPAEMSEIDGVIYMQANGPDGKEFYGFNMTTKQIDLLANIATGYNEGGSPLSSYPNWITPFNGEVYFNAAVDAIIDRELWVYNPTTGAVREIVIDDGDNILGGALSPSGGNPSYLTEFEGKLYFQAQQVPVGVELFVYDPVTDLVSLAWDSYPGQYYFCGGEMETPPCLDYGNNGHTKHLTLRNGVFYFSATFENRELWYYNPNTDEGGQLLEFYPGLNPWGAEGQGSPEFITEFEGNLFMRASTDVYNDELMVVSWDPENCQ